MDVIRVRNVNEALPIGLSALLQWGVRAAPRGKAVIELPEPFATRYDMPYECVLFDPVRDANPFFHFFEALWIIAGRHDVAPLAWFNSKIAEYSDDGEKFNAPYGQRMRQDYGDQLMKVVQVLRDDPFSRRAVVQIWCPMKDLYEQSSKDLACNTEVVFGLRNGHLNMTVFNRSNDAIWGAYGANAVQFAFVQRYVADKLGVACGWYVQVSNNFHVYEDNPYWIAWKNNEQMHRHPDITNYYKTRVVSPYLAQLDLFNDPFDIDNSWFFEVMLRHEGELDPKVPGSLFYRELAVPFYNAHRAWKIEKDYDRACFWLRMIPVCDWRTAGADWIHRRYVRHNTEKTT